MPRKRSASEPRRLKQSKSNPALKARVKSRVRVSDGAATDDWKIQLERPPKRKCRARRIDDPVRHAYPEWSLGKRPRPPPLAGRSPGPIYAPNQDHYVKRQSPVWSLGRRWSLPAQPRRSPGPVYKPNPDSVLYVAPKWSMYGRTKDPRSDSCSPGPIYKPKLAKTTSALMTSRAPDWEKYKNVNTPGPAAYDVKVDYCRASKKRNVLIVSRTKMNDEIMKGRLPGPAKYVPLPGKTSTDPGSKCYSMGRKLPDPKPQAFSPGPGSYGPDIIPRFDLSKHIRKRERALRRRESTEAKGVTAKPERRKRAPWDVMKASVRQMARTGRSVRASHRISDFEKFNPQDVEP